MINKADIQRVLGEYGVAVDPDMADYDVYNVAIRSAHYWANRRARVADTVASKTIIYPMSAANHEQDYYSQRVDECLTIAWRHFTGARRYAYPERIEFPYELSKTWKETV